MSGAPTAPNKIASNAPQLVGAALRHHHAVLAVIIRPPVEMLDIEREPAVTLGADLQNLQTGIDHFGPDAVPTHRRDFVAAHLAS
jgi:hypothetical protein